MPRPSEIQAEENATPRSPLRRSCRIVAVSSPAPSEVKPVRGRRLSAVSNDGNDEEVTVEVKAASRATRAASVTKENGPNAEPAKPRGRRNSATTESSATEEKKPAARGRRSSVTKEETETETTKPIRGRRPSVTKEEIETETTKPTRGRRPSVTKEEIETTKPVGGRRPSITKEDAEEKKPVRGRRSSIQEDEESVKKLEEVRSTRSRRSMSRDLFDDTEETNVETVEKRTTRSRRGSVEAAEEKEDKKPAPRTPSKLKRRLSVTENAVVLDPIDESPTKPELSVVLTEVKANLDLSVISESEETEVARAKSRLSKERESINDEKDTDKSKEAPEKVTSPSIAALSVVLNKTLEGGRKTPELSVLLNKSLEDGKRTPDSPARRSPRLIEKCKSGEKHVHLKCDCVEEPPRKTKKIDFENKESSTKEPETTNSLKEATADEVFLPGTITEKQITSTKTYISDGSDGSFQLNLSKSKLQSTEDETDLNDSKTSESSDKENLAQNIDLNGKEINIKNTQLSDKKVLEDLTDLGNKEMPSQNVTVGRVSNVFRPKDIDYSYMEPMDVDMTLDTTKFEKSHLDSTKLQIDGANESVDETFLLNLDDTCVESPTEKDTTPKNVQSNETVNKMKNEEEKIDSKAKIGDLDKEEINEEEEEEEVINTSHGKISSENKDLLEKTIDQEKLKEKSSKKETIVQAIVNEESRHAKEDKSLAEVEKITIEEDKSPAKLDKSSTKEDTIPAEVERILTKENKSPAKLEKSPAKADTIPAKIETIPSKVETIPSKVETIPSKVETIPTKVDKSPAKVEKSPAKVEESPAKEDKIPGKVETSPAKIETIPTKVDKSPAKVEKSPAKVEESPAKKDKIPAKLETISAKLETIPSKVDKSPAKVEKSPAKLEKSPAKEDKIPAKIETIPTKVDKCPAKVERSPAKIAESPTKEDIIPANVETIPAKLETIPSKVDKSPAKVKESPTKEDTIPAKIVTISTKVDKSPAKVKESPKKENTIPAEVETIPTKEESSAKLEKSPTKEDQILKKPEKSPAKEEIITKDTSPPKSDAEDEDDIFEEKSMSEDYEFDIPSEEETENLPGKSKKFTNEKNPTTDIQKEKEEKIQKEEIPAGEINKSTEGPINEQTEEIDNEVCKEDRTEVEVEENPNKRNEENDINEMAISFKDVVNDDEAINAEPLENDSITKEDGQLNENAIKQAVEDKLDAAKEEQDKKIKILSTVVISDSPEIAIKQAVKDKLETAKEEQDKKIKRLSTVIISEDLPSSPIIKKSKRKSRGSLIASKDQEDVISPKMAAEETKRDSLRLSNDKSKTEKRFSLTEWFEEDIVKETDKAEPNPKSKKKKRKTIELNVSQLASDDAEEKRNSNISVEIIEDTADLNIQENKKMKKNPDISVEIIENDADLNIPQDKIKRLSLEEFANAKLDEYIAKKMNDFEAEDENSSSCSYEESECSNSFIDDMAEEGEEDTPSEDSNAIIDEGEAINSDSERSEDHDYDEDDADSFICDEEKIELLSGEEYDLGNEKQKKRKRIINVEHRNEDVIKFEKKPAPKPRKTRIIKNHDSSSDEEINVDEPSSSPSKKGKERTRSSSINIIENIDVKEIRDAALSSRINQLVDTFCTTIPDKGGVSMNLSLEFAANASSKEEMATTKRRSVERRTSLPSTEPSTSKRKSTESTKRNSISNEDLPSKQPRLSVSLIEDSNTKKSKQKRRLSQSMNSAEGESKKLKKRKTNKNKKEGDLNTSISSEDLRKHTFGLMSQLLNDVKNRPRRVMKPSTKKLEDLNSTWLVESDVQVKPSTTIVSEKEMEDFKQKKCHPKDFRQQVLHDSSRVKRIETKQLLKKKGAYY